MQRGSLRIYLGAAPGAGKTHAMLAEGLRRHGRGTDVMLAVLHSHGRRPIEELAATLPARPSWRAAWMSTPCWPAGRPWCWSTSWPIPTSPARSTRTGGRTWSSCWPPAWTWCTTLNIESWSACRHRRRSPASGRFGRSPSRWPGARPRCSSSTRRPRRCAAGWRTATSIPPSASTPPWPSYFRPGNLAALRELALLWVADRVEEGLPALPRRAPDRRPVADPATDRGGPRWRAARHGADPPGRPGRRCQRHRIARSARGDARRAGMPTPPNWLSSGR